MTEILGKERYEELKEKGGGEFDHKLFAVLLIAFMTRQHIVISTDATGYTAKSIQLVWNRMKDTLTTANNYRLAQTYLESTIRLYTNAMNSRRGMTLANH